MAKNWIDAAFDEFDESKIKRDGDGKFSSTGGVSSSPSGTRFKRDSLPEVPDGSIRLFHGTNGGNIESISSESFGGLFASPDEDAAESHGDNMHFMDVKTNEIASNDDLENNSDSDVVNSTIDRWVSGDASEETKELVKNAAIYDESVFDMDDDDADAVREALGSEDIGGANWEIQTLRGQIAKRLGFKAIEMEDEHGTSYLVLEGSSVYGIDSNTAKDSKGVAFDKASARHYDDNGFLIVDSTIITKAAVNPYYGKEIPDYESLGLDPEKIYNMLRDPAELEKGMHTLGEKQLLIKHIFVSADELQKESIAGTIGSNLEMVGDDVKGSLTVWDKEAINLIESGKLAELSASYFYDPVMQSGTFKGQPYDGIMTNIRGNHVALVERGRIGRDALVADALPKLMELNMKLKKGAVAKINAKLKASLAMDADIPNDVLKQIIEEVAENIEPTAEDTEEAEKLEGAEDEDEEEKAAEDTDETETADDEDEAEKAEPEVKKAAMDAAIKQAENKAVQRVTQLFEARELVKPLVGVVAMDSAEAVLKHALKKSGIDSDGVDTVKGLKTLVGLAIKQKSQPQIKTAMDSASYEADPLTDRFK